MVSPRMGKAYRTGLFISVHIFHLEKANQRRNGYSHDHIIRSGLAGALGWIMVKSGLNEENLYVSHIRLAIHFMAALGLLCYTLWFSFQFLIPESSRIFQPAVKKNVHFILGILVLQLIYGAFWLASKRAVLHPPGQR